jgi:hypothetical protein
MMMMMMGKKIIKTLNINSFPLSLPPSPPLSLPSLPPSLPLGSRTAPDCAMINLANATRMDSQVRWAGDSGRGGGALVYAVSYGDDMAPIAGDPDLNAYR